MAYPPALSTESQTRSASAACFANLHPANPLKARSSLHPLDEIPLAGWPFDLETTLNSGQVFHWSRHGAGWAGTIGETAVYLEQPEAGRLLCTAGKAETVARYLGLDHDLERIAATFPGDDAVLRRAVAFCPGIRLIRQPEWECLATFITSSMKRVPHIRQMSLTLRERFGKQVKTPRGLPPLWSYPSPGALAAAGEAALRACGLGYRARFLRDTAEAVATGAFKLETVRAATEDDAALALLRTLPGVGEKIAGCALLFAWERHGAFPVDVWIERALRRLYFNDAPEVGAKTLRAFACSHFGPYRGYAQQFLFHWARTGGELK